MSSLTNGNTNDAPPLNAVLLMDRFVSASSAQDAVESLQGMVDGFKQKQASTEEEFPLKWQSSWIWQHEDLADHLLYLLQLGVLKTGPAVEEGPNLVCQLYLFLAKDIQCLKLPGEGRLLEALLDVMDNPKERPIYTRVLALQVLELLSKQHISTACHQWLAAPNGLHRLADLLNTTENPMDEPVRNQALVVAQLLATQAPIAKVFLFAEVESGLLNLCWQQGGLTKGNAIVLDALCLVQELLKHADPALQDLVWQRPNVAPRLAQLLDLRGGDEFLHPPDPSTSSQRNTKKNSAADNDGIDDLDSLLQSGETRKTTLTEEDESEPFVPHLLPSEELVIQSVLQILHILLESESVRSNVWKAHSGLCSLVWELALVATPSQPPAFAMPSAQLQQAALELVAEKIADSVTMDQHHGMDRLLFLVCTGAAASSIQEKMGISQAALAVLRQVLNTERIHELLLNTLAPSPVLEGEAPGPTVVQKLWNTVAENLVAENNEIQVDPDRRTLFLSGALGGLALLLKDEQSRMMLYKVTPPMASIEHMLEALTTTKTTTGEDPNAVLHHQVQWTLLRFLCEWVCDTPFMVQTLLSSTVSTNLASMAADTKSPYTPLVHLLLGLAMHSLEAEQDCGGWTRAGILQLIKKTVGISKYTSSLEKLKTRKDLLPWTICDLEYQHWSQWYQKAVWVVRKRVVEELAGASSGGGASSSDEEEDKETNRAELGDTTTAAPPSSLTGRGKSKKSLQKLIARQAKEMDVLRQELDRAQTRIASQESQLGTWKRRMESTPTELDNLLSEFTSKTADLEETVQQMQKEVKDTKIQYEAEIQDRDEKVQKSRQEADQLRTQEQEAREDRERMEQELAALSQAYASLEEDYRHRQTGTSTSEAGAPTGQESQQQAQHQQQGEASQQQASSAGSTEVATLRAENARLRNDARAADEWMSMAVQRMNEMGSHSGNLEQQAVSLQQQIQELQTQSQTSQQQQERELRQEIAVIESQLQQERTLREGEISNAGGECNVLLESERQMGAQLSRQLENVQDEMRKTILAQKSEKQELEQSLHDAVTQQHQSGKEAGTTTSFQQPAEDNDRRLQQLIAELEATIESKNVEILSLNASLEQARQGLSTQPAPADHPSSTSSTASNGLVNQQLEAGRKEVEEIRHRSQEDIYKRESTIRELENRLSSGLGGFKLEDIRVRDEEIKELRAANEAAQDWMAKAVEHHQMLSSQVATLREEKAALSAQLVENKGQFTPNNANMASTKLLESELSAKSVEIERLQAEMARLNQSFQGLREESNSSQDIQQELGITREDVSILKQELAKSQEKVKTLEGRLKENALSEENKKLRASKDGLQSQLAEFQAWADVAQKKIADIEAAKANVDKQLSEANAQVRAKNSELAEKAAAIEKECEARTALATERDGLFQKAADLQSKLLAPDSMTSVLLDPETESDRSVIEQLKAEMASLETENKTLADIREKHEKKIVEIQAHSQELQAWTEGAQQEIADILSAKEGLEKLLAAEKELTKLCQDEIEELKKTLEKAPQKPLEDMRVLDDTAQPGGSMGVSNDAEEFFSSGGENAPVAAEGSVPIVDHLQQLLRVKEEELKVVQAQHSADEDIVHQWEGMFDGGLFLLAYVEAKHSIIFPFHHRASCRT